MVDSLRYILKQNKWFLMPYVLFFSLLASYVLYLDKHEGFLLLNPSGSTFFDTYFKYVTYLGDGVTAVLIGFIVLVKSKRNGIAFLSAFLIAGGITQSIKLLNSDILRPSAALGLEKVHQVLGVELHSAMSFPSGHTTAAFTIYFSLAILLQSKSLGFICLLMAIVVAYSRIYLSQHFPVDILIGSFIGVVITLVTFSFFDSKKTN